MHHVPISALFFALLTLLCGCKKDKETTEELPILGTCQPATASGRLRYTDPRGPYTYQTRQGGKIDIDLGGAITISHADYPNFRIEFWGDAMVSGINRNAGNHEGLNGKHIKDRWGSRRTLIFPDGTKITMVSNSETAPLVAVSIYDGAESHHINATCNTLEYSSTASTAITKLLDQQQADGETASFEITATGLRYFNLYTEDVPGQRVERREELGELVRDQPKLVNDLYDDPRLAHT